MCGDRRSRMSNCRRRPRWGSRRTSRAGSPHRSRATCDDRRRRHDDRSARVPPSAAAASASAAAAGSSGSTGATARRAAATATAATALAWTRKLKTVSIRSSRMSRRKLPDDGGSDATTAAAPNAVTGTPRSREHRRHRPRHFEPRDLDVRRRCHPEPHRQLAHDRRRAADLQVGDEQQDRRGTAADDTDRAGVAAKAPVPLPCGLCRPPPHKPFSQSLPPRRRRPFRPVRRGVRPRNAHLRAPAARSRVHAGARPIRSSPRTSTTTSASSSAGPAGCTSPKRLTEKLGGAKIYLKREDLNHTGAHKINNTIGQALL